MRDGKMEPVLTQKPQKEKTLIEDTVLSPAQSTLTANTDCNADTQRHASVSHDDQTTETGVHTHGLGMHASRTKL